MTSQPTFRVSSKTKLAEFILGTDDNNAVIAHCEQWSSIFTVGHLCSVVKEAKGHRLLPAIEAPQGAEVEGPCITRWVETTPSAPPTNRWPGGSGARRSFSVKVPVVLTCEANGTTFIFGVNGVDLISRGGSPGQAPWITAAGPVTQGAWRLCLAGGGWTGRSLFEGAALRAAAAINEAGVQ